jgi:cyclohexyl-isocyanide hydratase
MVLFPDLTIQDFIGPYEVFNKASCFDLFVVAETSGCIVAEGGLEVRAPLGFDDCPLCDILFVPGGRGITSLINHNSTLNFLQKQGSSAKYITAVCTGSVVLASAGLLEAYQATTHWRAMELLQMFGVNAIPERVVVDRNRITGGGVTAGIDFGLLLTALIAGEDVAKRVQLMLEYNPQPPFQSGSPRTAPPHIVEQVSEGSQALFDLRKKMIHQRLAQIKS